MKLIVGLGNPGKSYEDTRHNIGFHVISLIHNKYGVTPKQESKFSGITGKFAINNLSVVSLMPSTYMNLSGNSVIKIMNFYKILTEDILIIYDDISLDLGTIRYRSSGRDAGHNGVKSIISLFGGNSSFPRLKIGIGPDPGGEFRSDYVLSKFTNKEKKIVEQISPIIIESIEYFFENDIDKTMNKYNGMA